MSSRSQDKKKAPVKPAGKPNGKPVEKPAVASGVLGYLPDDTPPWGAMISLGLQQVLTMFPATVLVAVLTKFDVGVTLLASGLGTIIALLVSQRKIPMYYGSSFSYLAVIMAAMGQLVPECVSAQSYCPEGVKIVQVGILGTAIVEILIGLLIMRVGKAALDKVLPPIITGSMAMVIGVALAGAALNNASGKSIGITPDQSAPYWTVAFITLLATILFSVYLRGRGLLGMLPILFGAIFGYLVAIPFDLVNFQPVLEAAWFRLPAITLPAFGDPRAWGMALSISLVAIATIPESTAHLYQMSLYIDELADEMGRKPYNIKNLIGRNLIADGADDVVVGMLGGCPGTNYGENNSLMAITRNYSVPVLITAGVIAILLGFVGKLGELVYSLPVAVQGGLAIYLFGVIGMQGIALIQSEKVNLFEPRQLAVGAIILILGIGGNLALDGQAFPFIIPGVFDNGIPAIVFAALAGIVLNLIFLILPPAKVGAA